jgi:predicted small integral membrane protein
LGCKLCLGKKEHASQPHEARLVSQKANKQAPKYRCVMKLTVAIALLLPHLAATTSTPTSAPTVDPLHLHTAVGEGLCVDGLNQTYSHLSTVFAVSATPNEKVAALYCAQNMVSIPPLSWGNKTVH